MHVLMGWSNLSGAPMMPREDNSTTWACSQVTPPFPKCNPCLHRTSQGKKGVWPLGKCTSPLCFKVLLPTPIIQALSQSIIPSLCSSFVLSQNLPKKCAFSMGVTQCIFYVNIFSLCFFCVNGFSFYLRE
jgi:hypothetical protein